MTLLFKVDNALGRRRLVRASASSSGSTDGLEASETQCDNNVG